MGQIYVDSTGFVTSIFLFVPYLARPRGPASVVLPDA